MAAKDSNSHLSTWLQANYVATWPAGKTDLNTVVQRRLLVTSVAIREMTARLIDAVGHARDAA